MGIWLLRNAVEYEYAPSFLCFFAACMIVHSGASAPMYTAFLMLKLDPSPAKHGKRLSVLFLMSSVTKQAIMLTAHAANFWNYRLFFQEETFRLRDVSTAGWNNKPYFDIRMTARDLWLNVPWIEILMISLPILWVILALAQFYNTWVQFKIFKFEYQKVYNDGGDLAAMKKEEKPLDLSASTRLQGLDLSASTRLQEGFSGEVDSSSSGDDCKNSDGIETKEPSSDGAS